MNQTKSSSSDLKMATSFAFEQLLDQIKCSNLNYHLQQSPFAAIISLKKSLIKDMNGVPLPPYLPVHVPTVPVPPARHCQVTESKYSNLEEQIMKLEKANKYLESAYEEAVLDGEQANKNISTLEEQLEILKTKLGDVKIDNLKVELRSISLKYEKSKQEVCELKTENENLKKSIAFQSTQLKAANRDLKDAEKLKNQNVKTLETEMKHLKEFKIRHDIEKAEVKKKQKRENKKKKKEFQNDAKENLAKKAADKFTNPDSELISWNLSTFESTTEDPTPSSLASNSVSPLTTSLPVSKNKFSKDITSSDSNGSEMLQQLMTISNNESTSALDLSLPDKFTTASQVSLSLNTTSLLLTPTSPLTLLNPPSGESSTLGTTENPPATLPPFRTAARTDPAVLSPSASQSKQEFKNEILRRLYGRRN